MKRYHYILAGAMVLTGTMNTLVVKYADNACAKGVDYYPLDDSEDDNPCSGRARGDHQFDHPFVQAMAMFIGEFTCMLAYKLIIWNSKRKNEPPPMDIGKQNWNPLIFFVPALCDCGATSLMYLGMTYTYPSQFQMLRGSVVIFTGLLSFFWLKRRLTIHHWIGMLFVLFGLGVVGLSAVLSGSSGASAPNPVLGDILIVCAQVIVALQMVVEEKFLTKHQVPALQAVGWEGIFGMGVMSLMCIIFYYVPGPRAGKALENVNDAFLQFDNSVMIKAMILTMICSIAFFNFCGISVTKEMSATTRMVLDNVRTITVWAYGVGVGWEKVAYLEIIGFLLLLTGTLVYNDIVIAPLLRHMGILKSKEGGQSLVAVGEKTALLSDEDA